MTIINLNPDLDATKQNKTKISGVLMLVFQILVFLCEGLRYSDSNQCNYSCHFTVSSIFLSYHAGCPVGFLTHADDTISE